MNILRKNLRYVIITILFVVLLLSLLIWLYQKQAKAVVKVPVKSDLVDFKLFQFSDRNEVATSTENIGNKAIKTTKNVVVKAASIKTGCNLSISENSIENSTRLIYTIKLSNQGNTSCVNSSLSAYYDDSLNFISSLPKTTASNYYWQLGKINPGEVKTINITLEMSDSKTLGIDTQVCATADDATDACTNTIKNVTKSNIASTVKKVPTLTAVPNTNLEYGSWVWVSPVLMSQDYMRKIVDGASANGINVLYVTIDDYLETDNEKNYTDAIERFVRIAKEKNITVDLEAGWRDWAQVNNRQKAFKIVDFVIKYNNTHLDKIRAIQYDIEPYLLSTYENNKVGSLKDFISLLDETVTRLGNNSLAFSVVIPHFYDNKQAWTPEINYKGKSEHAFDHVLKIMDKRLNSKIIVMAYRNTAEGEDGTINLSNTEIEEASKKDRKTKIIIGQESGDVEPNYVTFFSLPKADYIKQKHIITNNFKEKSGFGGIAIHYIDSLLDLK